MSSSNPQFSPIDLIKASWGPTTANAGPLIGGVVLALIITFGSSFIPFVGPLLVQGPLQFGLYTVALAASRGKVADFQDVFAGFQNFVPAFVAGLLVGIFTTIGTIFCVIPGILVSILYLPVYLYMIEEKLDFWPAMERSRIVVMDNFAQWGLLFLVIFLMNAIATVFTCGLGLLITIPMTMVTISKAFDIQNGRGRMAPPSLDAEFGA
jgi:uncharacterized membrane protein